MSEDNLSEKTAPTDDEFEYENDSDDIELYADADEKEWMEKMDAR